MFDLAFLYICLIASYSSASQSFVSFCACSSLCSVISFTYTLRYVSTISSKIISDLTWAHLWTRLFPESAWSDKLGNSKMRMGSTFLKYVYNIYKFLSLIYWYTVSAAFTFCIFIYYSLDSSKFFMRLLISISRSSFFSYACPLKIDSK